MRLLFLILFPALCFAEDVRIFYSTENNAPSKEALLESFEFSKVEFKKIGIDLKLKSIREYKETDLQKGLREKPNRYIRSLMSWKKKHFRKSEDFFYFSLPSAHMEDVAGLAWDICPLRTERLAFGQVTDFGNKEFAYYRSTLMAHELGHLFGGVHDDRPQSFPRIMSTYIDQFINIFFKTGVTPRFSRDDLIAIKTCFDYNAYLDEVRTKQTGRP